MAWQRPPCVRPQLGHGGDPVVEVGAGGPEIEEQHDHRDPVHAVHDRVLPRVGLWWKLVIGSGARARGWLGVCAEHSPTMDAWHSPRRAAAAGGGECGVVQVVYVTTAWALELHLSREAGCVQGAVARRPACGAARASGVRYTMHPSIPCWTLERSVRLPQRQGGSEEAADTRPGWDPGQGSRWPGRAVAPRIGEPKAQCC